MLRRWFVAPLALVALGPVLLVVTTQGCASFGGLPSGPRLDRMQASAHWKDGHFVNAEPTAVMQEGGAGTMLEWFSSDVMRVPSCPLPLATDTRAVLDVPPKTGLRVTWLGHSTTILEVDGVTVLTDPMFSERASPSTIAGPKRFHPPPLALDQLPRIDAVVISHDHYDHLDMRSIQALAAKGVPIHVGLGVGAHLEAWGVPPAQIHELEWWEERSIGALRIVSTPARHFSGRRGFGNDRALWTSWTFVGPEHRVFFSGDTGLTPQFKDIATRLGPLDVSLLEIGQWHPAWGAIHLGPQGALEAHAMLSAKHLIPIHWATFELGLHAWNEPPETLVTQAEKTNTSVVTPRLGQPIEPLAGEVGSRWWRALPPLAAECPDLGTKP
ncbi:MAG: MBL fold metallo-hydrolase [Myxococcaceae bacterium]|nr:MBL fold metallo-hydrolase [Myxococcaceae bacterium]